MDFQQAPAVDCQRDLVADFQRVLGADCQVDLVADYRRARAEVNVIDVMLSPLYRLRVIYSYKQTLNRDKGIFVATPRISCEAAERQPGGASPTSAQAVTNSASRSTAPSSSTSATGGFASCSRLRTKMLH